jgi:hypothetical protein
MEKEAGNVLVWSIGGALVEKDEEFGIVYEKDSKFGRKLNRVQTLSRD